MSKKKVPTRQAQLMKRNAKRQWIGFWIILVMFLSVLIAALVYLFS